MLKIKELLKDLACTQEKISKELKELNENLKPQIETIRINSNKLNTCSITIDRLDNFIESNIYNKEQTIETINKECDYREQFKKCDETNSALLNLIQDYCKFDDKYEIIKLFRMIDAQYEVKERKTKKVEE